MALSSDEHALINQLLQENNIALAPAPDQANSARLGRVLDLQENEACVALKERLVLDHVCGMGA